MPTLTVSMRTRPGNPLSTLPQRLKQFTDAELRARKDAAATATRVSRQSFRYLRPADAPDRPGRQSTHGRFTDGIEWTSSRARGGGVRLNVAKLTSHARYWLIQEIGTGPRGRATIYDPIGRGPASSGSSRSIKSQVGRRVNGLVFATGPTGNFARPGRGRGQGVYTADPRSIKGLPSRTGFTIRREIQGKHFIRKGGLAGFRQYRQQVQAAAQRAFGSRRFKP